MSEQAMYKRGQYHDLSEPDIEQQVTDAGFDPIRISDPPGRVYPLHSHAETKLLAFLRGSMRVQAQGHTFECAPGDQLIIPGNVEHSAVVGQRGCVYFWSEKLLD